MGLFILRHQKRLREVVQVLIRHGYGAIIDRLPLPFFVRRWERIHGVEGSARLARNTREALEELGPTFIKFGQILSTRRDLLPLPFIREFERLQEHVEPFSTSAARAMIRSELGQDPDEIFDHFPDEPAAAASIAQVYYATYQGERVAVKVQRPDVRRLIEEDMAIVHYLAELIDEYIEEARIYSLPALTREFRSAVQKEVDFYKEADNIEFFNRAYADHEDIVIPQVYRQASSGRVLTMTRLEGERIRDVETLDPKRRRSLADTALDLFFLQFFEGGIFHADPHPGNFLLIENKKLGLLDYGRVSMVDDELESKLSDLMMGVMNHDYSLLADTLIKASRNTRSVDKAELERDLMELVEFNYHKPVGQLRISDILFDLTQAMQRHKIYFPENHMALITALVGLEAVAYTLDPNINFPEAMFPRFRELMMNRRSPKRLFQRTYRSFRNAYRQLENLPERLASILRLAEAGEFAVKFHHEGLDDFLQGLEGITRRIVAGLIIAALIVSGALIIQIDRPPFIAGYPALGMVAFSLAFLLSLWVFVVRRY